MNEVEEIKERINIEEIVSSYLELKKAGANYKAPCPFHTEKSPSFMVSTEKQIFKCFGCGAGGDVFEFLMKIENLTFPEALQILADKAGVQLQKIKKSPTEYKKELDEKTVLFKINKISAQVFHKILISDNKICQNARKYLEKRKVTAQIIDKFMIGFAPENRILQNFLYKRGYTQNQFEKAGNPQKFYDRIIFPIFDVLGNPIAFTGRALSDEMQPKYLNTPETQIFHKGKILYALNFAKEAIREEKFSIVLEGQMDIVLSHLAEVYNVVATSGTAITIDHIKILSRYSSNIAFCFDQDLAGFNATQKAILLAYEVEISPYIIRLPKGYKDVGELVEKDPKKWQEISKIKIPAFEWLIESILTKFKNNLTANDKKEVLKELIPYLLKISDPLEQAHYKKIIAQKVSIADRILSEVMDKFIAKLKISNNNISIQKITLKKALYEEKILGFLFIQPEFCKLLYENSKLTDFKFKDVEIEKIYKLLFNCYNNDKKKINTQSCQEIIETVRKNISKDLEKQVDILALEISKESGQLKDEELVNEFLDYLLKIKQNKNTDVKEKYAKLISDAEGKKDIKEVKKLLEEFQNKICNK